MEDLKLAVIGIGHPRFGMAVLASLATYFGERPLQIRLYDSDAEFLEMYDRLARLLFKTARNGHGLSSTEHIAEALEEADRAILQMSNRSERFFSRRRKDLGMQFAVDEILRQVPPETKVLSLQEPEITYSIGVFRLTRWAEELEAPDQAVVPHQVNRFLRDDDTVYELLKANERSPIKEWLDNPKSAEFLNKTPVD